MEVRPARPADADALRDLHVRTYEATYRGLVPDEIVDQRLQEHRQREWAELVDHVLVAEAGESPLGLCEFWPTDEGEGYVHRLSVDPNWQGKGVGRLLLEAACDSLRTAGCSGATLWVLEIDPRARGFYEHLGWRPDGARREESAPDIRYRLTL